MSQCDHCLHRELPRNEEPCALCAENDKAPTREGEEGSLSGCYRYIRRGAEGSEKRDHGQALLPEWR